MEEINWGSVRADYPVLDKCTYLNTASSGAIAKSTADAMRAFADDQWSNATLNRSAWLSEIEMTRSAVAKMVGAIDLEIAFTPDVSIAMSMTAQALENKERIALLRDEFPSVVLPWISHGYDVTWIERAQDQTFDLADFEKALNDGIKIVAVSWVHYNSGITTDLVTLGKMCKAYGALFIVDCTQGLGAIPMDVKTCNIDILMASTFKWLTGGYGTCLLYISEGIKKQLNQRAMGWNSLIDFEVDPQNQENWKIGAPSFEPGHLKYSNVLTFSTALQQIKTIGVAQINKHINSLTTYLEDRLSSIGLSPIAPGLSRDRSGIMTVRLEKSIYDRLNRDQIIATYREDYIRLSLHFYNDFKDIDRLTEAISGYSHSN